MEDIVKQSNEIIDSFTKEYDRKDLEELVSRNIDELNDQDKKTVYKAMFYSFLMKIVDKLKEEEQEKLNKKIDSYLNSGMNIREAIGTVQEMIERGGENFRFDSIDRDENGEHKESITVKDGKIECVDRS